MPLPFHAVAYARPAPIGNRQLDQLILIAKDAQFGNTDEARAEWLLSCAPALLEELRARRAAEDLRDHAAVPDNLPLGENVIVIGPFPTGHRA
jgi:hypothetical protein